MPYCALVASGSNALAKANVEEKMKTCRIVFGEAFVRD